MRKVCLAALLLVFFATDCLHAVWQTDAASARNLELAIGLLGAKNACAHETGQPSLQDPFSVASVDIVSLVPQVDNSTSDLSSPSLLWSWSADYPAEVKFALAGRDGCPGGEMELYMPAQAQFSEGRLEYAYGSSVRTVGLSSDGPNPVELELDSAELQEEDYASLHARLSARISGKVSVTYNYRKSEYSQSCSTMGGYVGCGCEERAEYGTRRYERALSDEKNFSVETGQDEFFWLNPPLKVRLDGESGATALLFARRLPATISASADGRPLGENAPYVFRTVTGPCGQVLVQTEYAPSADGMEAEAANKTLFPYQLARKNASYLPFYLKFAWDESPGRKELSIAIEDRFSNRQNYTYKFFVRSPSPYSGAGQAEGMQLRQGSDVTTPAAYPAREEVGNIPQFGGLGILLGAAALAAVGGALLRIGRME